MTDAEKYYPAPWFSYWENNLEDAILSLETLDSHGRDMKDSEQERIYVKTIKKLQMILDSIEEQRCQIRDLKACRIQDVIDDQKKHYGIQGDLHNFPGSATEADIRGMLRALHFIIKDGETK